MKYTLPQVMKSVVALLTALVAVLGMIAGEFGSGPLHDVGYIAALVMMALNPILVFLVKAEVFIDPFTETGIIE